MSNHEQRQEKVRLSNILELQKVLIREALHIMGCPECQQRLAAIEGCMDERMSKRRVVTWAKQLLKFF